MNSQYRLTLCGITTFLVAGCGQAPTPQSIIPDQRRVCNYLMGVDEGRAVVAFRIHNDSQVTKIVSNVRKSCNCYQAELSDTTLSPGETETLSFYMHQPTLRGPSKKTIQCILEFEDDTRCTCTADCTAYPALSWNDHDLQLGDIEFATVTHCAIPVTTYSRERHPPVIEVESESPECTVEPASVQFSTSVESDGVWQHHGTVVCTIAPKIDRKGGGARLTLLRVHESQSSTEVLSLGWSTRSQYGFHPRMLVLRGVKDSPDMVAEVSVSRSGGTGPVKIERVEHSHEQVLKVEVHQHAVLATAELKLSLKGPVDGAPLYGDVLVYFEGCRAPLNVPFVVVP